MKFSKFFESFNCGSVKFSSSNSPANLAVVVKVNKNEGWQDTVHSVLSRLEGVNRFELDAEQGLVKILGNLEPDMLMRILRRSCKSAEISRTYLARDGVVEDIFAEELPPCPHCPPDNCCDYHKPYYYDNNICYGRVPYYDNEHHQPQALQPWSSLHGHGGGQYPGISYYPSLPPPALGYQPSWPQPVHIEPYYGYESSAWFSIM